MPYSILRYDCLMLSDIGDLGKTKNEGLRFVTPSGSDFIEIRDSTNETVTIGYFDGRRFQNMRKAGVHDGVTNAITGHSDRTMQSRYDVVDFNDLMKGIQKLEDFLESVDHFLDQNPYFHQKRG